jgi:bifunctional N-acetylglucosamine-1-phosphate-uridyltransferase/glucosamine-1-phosphate-acetyltransferase GlmU-like protein
MTNPTVYPVIMAGGSGTRFWPLSRQLFPKQLLKIIGDETLIQQTMRRVVTGAPPERVMISTNPPQAESIRVQLREWKDALKDNFVLEPEARNTAPAIALVALELLRRDPNAVMLVVPADHIVNGQRTLTLPWPWRQNSRNRVCSSHSASNRSAQKPVMDTSGRTRRLCWVNGASLKGIGWGASWRNPMR